MNNDLISRSALEAKAKTIYMEFDNVAVPTRVISIADLHLAPTVDDEPVRQWISVKDALPDRQCEYLVRYGFGEPIIQSYSGVMYFVLYDERPHFENDGLYGLKVTHWMPLPEPPKEDAH